MDKGYHINRQRAASDVLPEANTCRIYAFVSIVVWHCFFCPLTAWNVMPVTDIVTFVFRLLAPEANMPLFVCLSGYLFAFLYEGGKPTYSSFTDLRSILAGGGSSLQDWQHRSF